MHSSELSQSARSVWAKSSPDRHQWLPLYQHLMDAGSVAEYLFDVWLAPGARRLWSQAFPGGEADARIATTWAGHVHDVGKASPAFSCQVGYLAEHMAQHGLTMHGKEALAHRASLHHTLMGEVASQAWLSTQGASRQLKQQLSSLVGAHHGRPVDIGLHSIPEGKPELTGGTEWASIRTEFLYWVGKRTGLTDRLQHWSDVRLPQSVLVGMSGLVIMADWLASNVTYFPYLALNSDKPLSPAAHRDRVAAALDQLQLEASWTPSVPNECPDVLYHNRFGWSAEFQPTTLQQKVVEELSEFPSALVFIEASMGSGKTEAGYIAGELLAARWGAAGLVIALPTQATTNSMYARALKWLEHQPKALDTIPWSLTLAHGKASLNPLYADQMAEIDKLERAAAERSDVWGIHDEEGTCKGGDTGSAVAVYRWFRGRKVRLLANFSVATIDQILMLGLEAKHLMLRHLALMGKIVIIDEAHAADEYMQVYLERALRWLGEYLVPVVIMSATLPSARREALARAYLGGRELAGVEVLRTPPGYPMLTMVAADGSIRATECPVTQAEPTVHWEWGQASTGWIVQHLQSLGDQGCILIIRNSVSAAQETAQALTDRGIGPLTLNHARFLSVDRAAKDEELLELFGPAATNRPRRHIVVATQVAEQSLDVDFDYLISDLAPIDLVLQRIGRLHRHQRVGRPAAFTERRACLLMDPEKFADGLITGNCASRNVYGEHLLLRTSAALTEHGQTIQLPQDIPRLVEIVYGEHPIGPPSWQSEMAQAAAKHVECQESLRGRAQTYLLRPPQRDGKSLNDWLMRQAGDADENKAQALVRDIRPSVEVIVVPMSSDGACVTTPPWQDGRVISVRSVPDDETARQIAGWAVRLPPFLTSRPDRLESVIAELYNEPSVQGWEWHRHPLLRGELFLPMRQTHEGVPMLEATVIGHRLTYSPTQGLVEP